MSSLRSTLLAGSLAVALAWAWWLAPSQPTLAQGTPAEKRFTIEVSRNGFRLVDGPTHMMRGQTHLAINQGDQVTVTFLYADTDYRQNNPHRIAISRLRVDAGLLDADNPRRTVTFVARREGEALFRCVKICEGHKRLQDGRLMVMPMAGAVTPQPTGLAVDIPVAAAQGREIALAALLTDASGAPVQGEPLRFLVPTDLFVTGWVEAGEVITDSSGVAVVHYRPGRTGDLRVRVSFDGDSAYLPSEVTSTLRITGGVPLYVPEAGLSVPQLGPAVAFGGAPGFRVPTVAALSLTVLVLAIWGTYLLVLRLVYRISRE